MKQLYTFFASHLFFPIMLIGFPGLAWILSEENQILPLPFVLIMLVGVSAILIRIFEKLFPFDKSWNDPLGEDWTTDKKYVAFSPVFMAISKKCFLLTLDGLLPGWLSARLHLTIWNDSPFVLQLLLAFIITEALHYLIHRWCHENPLGWSLHAVHHSPERLHALNSLRSHFLDILIRLVLPGIVLSILGASRSLIIVYTLSSNIIGLFQHSNINISYKGWNYIFSTADLHRFHHAQNLAEANTNYGKNLILFDWLFGTRYLPANKAIPNKLGITGSTIPRDFMGQFLFPFFKKATTQNH